MRFVLGTTRQDLPGCQQHVMVGNLVRTLRKLYQRPPDHTRNPEEVIRLILEEPLAAKTHQEAAKGDAHEAPTSCLDTYVPSETLETIQSPLTIGPNSTSGE